MEDEKIVALYFERNENAIRESDAKYGRFLFSIAKNILTDAEDSKECVNDTYLKAWNTIPPSRPKRLNLFLGRITRYTSIDRLRSKLAFRQSASGFTLALDELKEGMLLQKDVIAEKIDADHLSALIEAFLDTLPADEKNIFVGRYFYMDSIREIAHVTRFSESKIKSCLYRIRKELKTYLEKEGVSL